MRQGKPADSRDLEEGATADLDIDGRIIEMEILEARPLASLEGVDSMSFEVVTSALRRIA